MAEYGFDGVHFQYVRINDDFQKLKMICDTDKTEFELISDLGYSSMTHYQFVHFMSMKDITYENAIQYMLDEWQECDKSGITYFPHVSLGWNPNPSFKHYFKDVMKNPKPEYIERAFRLAKEFVDNHSENPPLIVINSWNEWTEGSYFEPDNLYGYGYLEGAKNVFYEIHKRMI